MGGYNWSDADYAAKTTHRAATGTTTFDYSDKVSRGVYAAKAHDTLDPLGIKGVRESRDSDVHPTSNAVAFCLDVTGSMSSVPGMVQKDMVNLMGLLLRNGYLPDPAILISAVGDATCDRVPFQVGQFESDIKIEENLTNLYLEGGGGGQNTESYELFLYFLARKTAADCYEKRGNKGYAFITGDERPYPQVSRAQVKKVFGDVLEADIPLETILAEVQQKWNLFFIIPRMTSNWGDSTIESTWQKLLGERFLRLDDPHAIAALIASTIGACEGSVDTDSLVDDLVKVGYDASTARSVSKAIVPVSGSAPKGTPAKVSGSGAGSGLAAF